MNTIFVASMSLGCHKTEPDRKTSSPAEYTPEASIRTKPAIQMVHDFGKMSPRETARHIFSILNNSDNTWTLGRIEKTCSCTVTRISTDTISPGTTALVEVTYTSPNDDGNATKTAIIQFNELNAPDVHLTVNAKVRPDIGTSRKSIEFYQVAKGQPTEEWLEVTNYSGKHIGALAISTTQEWLQLETTESVIDPPSDLSHPSQHWRVKVRLLTDHVKPTDAGGLQAELSISADGIKTPPKIMVRVHLVPPVKAIPARLILTSGKSNVVLQAKTLLHFARNSGMESSNEMVVEHNLGDRLTLSWAKRGAENTVWELSAELTPVSGELVLNGEIILNFTHKEIPQVTIPVYALIENQ